MTDRVEEVALRLASEELTTRGYSYVNSYSSNKPLGMIETAEASAMGTVAALKATGLYKP